MVKYQVFPDINVSVYSILKKTGSWNEKNRYMGSLELFRFLKKNPGTCVMTEKTMGIVKEVLRNYGLSKNEVENRIIPLDEITTIKTIEKDKLMKKRKVVDDFLNRFMNRQIKGGISLGQITPRYRGLVASCYQGGDWAMVSPPNEGDRIILSEAMCLSDEGNKTYIASYDFHFVKIGEDIENELGIIAGKPMEIIDKINRH